MSVEFFSRQGSSYTPKWINGLMADLATTASFWTPASGKKFVITDLHLWAAATGTIRLYTSAANQDLTEHTLLFQDLMVGSTKIERTFGTPLVSPTTDGILRIVTGANGNVMIQIGGFEI